MELVFKGSSVALAGSFVMLVVMILQLLSCVYVHREVQDVKDNEPMKIYWSLNMAVQFFGTAMGTLGLYVVHLISK